MGGGFVDALFTVQQLGLLVKKEIMMELKFPITPDQISLTRSRLSSLGIPLTGNSGTLTAKGITAEYEYGGGYLVVRVMKKPTLISNSLVKVKLEEWLGVKSV